MFAAKSVPKEDIEPSRVVISVLIAVIPPSVATTREVKSLSDDALAVIEVQLESIPDRSTALIAASSDTNLLA